MNVRFSAMAWNWGVDALREVSLPSLLARDNIPWLLAHGFGVSLSVYTMARDVAAVRIALASALANLSAPAGSLSINVGPVDLDPSDGASLKRIAFLTECRLAIDEGTPVFMTAADAFYGNGSIRNLCVYGQKPGVALAVLYSRVKREPFLRLLAEHRSTRPGEPVSNAKLVDMANRTSIGAISDSYADRDRNASFHTGAAFRRLTPDIDAAIYHLPSPVMFWPQESDVAFFDDVCAGVYESIDHLWPAKLIAERRWRMMASSDLFFLAELCSESTEEMHGYPLEAGRLFNEDYAFELPHTLISQTVVSTLRREP